MFAQLETWQYYALIFLGLINLYTFILYFVDKRRAIARKHRIPEKKLLTFTFLFGGIGAILGMSVFRHKTKTLKFKISAPLAFIFTMLSLWLIIQF
ncbi:Uncharacterized membrane protein YsdA, DUF1294 family [Atopostipes suicloacalis DSM 15692]|uniref:Uncharacterized membrane protein YsdA, DUF1294 family n=1 Tax=Atopostipes suicloacalis DSM 15692 TaxID=1121025 RepID=A0A1M4U180_9LACT|nr:DUF1294 domain-containing protein [Atopostipes suicloacalis]SHE50482.1 Uncharacterized membrane protein YsdA, DUF1294 family [Atopostipes suicloacalis DSM 15692]